jgi:large conductance mechanosensitive channel
MAKIKSVGKSAIGFWSEFKNFAVKGNAFDLAIAVVIGNAFSAIVNSLVADIITPLLGLFTGSTTDIKKLSLDLAVGGSPILLNYGAFMQTIINFFVIALSIFLVFKIISSARKRLFSQGDVAPQHTKPAQERLLEEIRDLLKATK